MAEYVNMNAPTDGIESGNTANHPFSDWWLISALPHAATKWPNYTIVVAVPAVDKKYWTYSGGDLVEMSPAEKADVDALDLIDLKIIRHAEIDRKTDELIGEGFVFDNEVFSMSPMAQHNSNAYKLHGGDFTFPKNVTKKNNDTYALANADRNPYMTAMLSALHDHQDTGRVLKKSIFDAVDKAAVDLIIDNR